MRWRLTIAVAAVLIIGGVLGDAFQPFGLGSSSRTKVVYRRTLRGPATPVLDHTAPRPLHRLPGAGRAKGVAWMAGTFAHPRLYVKYVCASATEACTAGLGGRRIRKPIADLAGHTGSVLEKPVTTYTMLNESWVLVTKHAVRGTEARERRILRVSAPQLLDDLVELRRRAAG